MKQLLSITAFLVLLCFSTSGQNTVKLSPKAEQSYQQALQRYREGDTQKSAAMLQQIIKTYPTFYLAYFALADIYHAEKMADSELSMLSEGLKIAGDQFPNGYKFMAELLYKKGDYIQADQNFKEYSRIKGALADIEMSLKQRYAFAAEAFENPVPFKPCNPGASINSLNDEYWPSLNAEANRLVFTRLVKFDSQGSAIQSPQEDFWYSDRDSLGWNSALPLGEPVNSHENEGAQSLSADGRLLFFTACNRPEGWGSCDIYMSVSRNGKWSDPVNLGESVNSKFWDSQPSVSADGRLLYFVSNRPGGKGKMDIWQAEKMGVSAEGFPVYGAVKTVDGVNTSGNDFSPFIHADGSTLYFASDEWPGLGGADLFKTNISAEKADSVINLGFPLNTSGNEEGLVVEVAGGRAWYTAENELTHRRDILYFDLPENVQPGKVSYVKGRVIDAQTNDLLIPDLKLNDLNEKRLVRHIYPFENDGEFLFCLPSGRLYGLSVSLPGYLFRSFNFDLQDIRSLSDPLYLEIALQQIKPNQSTVLSNIFFDTDSWLLKPESEVQLAEIVTFLQQNPNLRIEIGGHTDNTGTEIYNHTLSDKRAREVVDRLVDMGADSARIVSRGYGMMVPIGNNATAEGRAQNRRTEMKVVQLIEGAGNKGQ